MHAMCGSTSCFSQCLSELLVNMFQCMLSCCSGSDVLLHCLSQKTQATPLCVACLMKDATPVKRLLDKGASPNGAEEVCMYVCFNDEGEVIHY